MDKECSIVEVKKINLQDKLLFESTGGGVTVTGGEPGLYSEFVAELFKHCKSEGIHTAFDISGCIPPYKLEPFVAYTDIFYLDLKIWDVDNGYHIIRRTYSL